MNYPDNKFFARNYFCVTPKDEKPPVRIFSIGEEFEALFLGAVESPPGELSKMYEWMVEQKNCKGNSFKRQYEPLEIFVIRDACKASRKVSIFWNGEGFCLGVNGENLTLPESLESST